MMFSKYNICSLIIILFHAVGLYGFLNPELQSLFIKLVPFHLLLMFLLMAISGYDGSKNILLFSFVVYSLGFLVEVLGTRSGLLFGSYSYGDTLGVKLWQTPLLIGINWLILIYATGILLNGFISNKYLLALLGAVILVIVDFLIEPVAVMYDYWSWAGDVIPVRNYVGWFGVSFILFLFFANMSFKKRNPSAIILFLAQACFFMILNKWGT